MNKSNTKIVVLGGSFNPPTIAHLELMRSAMDAIGADKGIFLPTSFQYVERKMKKREHKADALPDNLRIEMLESFCRSDSRFFVSDSEIKRTKQRYNYETLEAIQEQYPDSEIYFIVGADKLNVIPRWHRIEEFVERFRILAARRGADDPDAILGGNAFLTAHRNAFTVFDVPEGMEEISSSAFWEKLRTDDRTAEDLVTKEVFGIMRENGKIPWLCINSFCEEYDFLSNFYEAEISYDGLTYGSSEAAYQAQKCLTVEEKLPFTEARPSRSKRLGRKVQLRPDWEEVKAGIMEKIVRAKFTQHPELAALLLATGDTPLVEGNTWGDVFWGVDTRTGKGENHLGRILMKIRDELSRQACR